MMAGSPRVSIRSDQPYVTIPVEARMADWRPDSGLFAELLRWLDRMEIAMAGPPFFRYWVTGGANATIGLEMGVPVAANVEGDGRVFADAIPAGTYATLIHEGHPDDLDASHAKLREWADREGVILDSVRRDGREIWGGRYEFFLTDPVEEADANRWRIEIVYRIREEGADGAAEA